MGRRRRRAGGDEARSPGGDAVAVRRGGVLGPCRLTSDFAGRGGETGHFSAWEEPWIASWAFLGGHPGQSTGTLTRSIDGLTAATRAWTADSTGCRSVLTTRSYWETSRGSVWNSRLAIDAHSLHSRPPAGTVRRHQHVEACGKAVPEMAVHDGVALPRRFGDHTPQSVEIPLPRQVVVVLTEVPRIHGKGPRSVERVLDVRIPPERGHQVAEYLPPGGAVAPSERPQFAGRASETPARPGFDLLIQVPDVQAVRRSLRHKL